MGEAEKVDVPPVCEIRCYAGDQCDECEDRFP